MYRLFGVLFICIAFAILYGVPYVGYEMLPDGWFLSSCWWSFPVAMTMGLVGILGILSGITGWGLLIHGEDILEMIDD
jgi:hypothetical protein